MSTRTETTFGPLAMSDQVLDRLWEALDAHDASNDLYERMGAMAYIFQGVMLDPVIAEAVEAAL